MNNQKENSSNASKPLPTLTTESNPEEFDMIEKIMKKGDMVRILRATFTKDEFVVDHIYRGIRA